MLGRNIVIVLEFNLIIKTQRNTNNRVLDINLLNISFVCCMHNTLNRELNDLACRY